MSFEEPAWEEPPDWAEAERQAWQEGGPSIAAIDFTQNPESIERRLRKWGFSEDFITETRRLAGYEHQ